MTTLSKRATPSQAMILRIVEGSIKNVCDAHNLEFAPRFARSVAKRAAGTLSAEMQTVLAAKSVTVRPVTKPSEKTGAAQPLPAARAQIVKPIQSAGGAHACKPRGGSRLKPQNGAVRASLIAAPFRSLTKQLTKDLWKLKEENPERAQAFVDVLKMIEKLTEGG